ncbi:MULTISPECIES: hypothetical protein [Actinosynnema]|uniref:hypothetical protein n=1 Tax=Actinosynnema TaxID=40566 RepID=UPI0020A29083|nr:hypothetical protein [Actinosynnema pretiosum]
MIIFAALIILYLVFTAFIVWLLSARVPNALGRTLIAVTSLVAGLPPILLVLTGVMA